MARRMASARSAGQDPSDGTGSVLGSDFLPLVGFSCAMGTQEIFFPSSPTETFSVQSPLSARSLEKLEKSPRDIFHPEIQKGREGLSYPGRQTQRCPRRYRDCKNHKKQLGLQRKQTGENKRSCSDAFTEAMAGESQLLEKRRQYYPCAARNCATAVSSAVSALKVATFTCR
uniref:uncharacterized protein LOC129117709 isoform X3 n=1 Tax=Agelaius phoeniceus TaxID=39638 RepID=UPI0023EBFB19|nr:uncharacterized protein LOC129117709 isoform X3 [Agelaius phoeniceus]